MTDDLPHAENQRVRPEYKPKPGESQADAFRCEMLILIDYAHDAGMTDDEIDQVLREIFDARAAERRSGFKIVDGGKD